MPAFELNDAIIRLDNLWGSETGELEECILGATNNLDRIHLIENFLFKKLREGNEPDPLVRQAVHLIYRHHGMVSMRQLTQTLGSEERNLERRFRKNVGISPKTFSGTIRLQYFIKLLHNASQRAHLTRLGYECGYFDQSHLIREFKKNVGITPRQYLSGANLLAVNFIQFPATVR
jgi:AraC-like DNA-binding protein